jgi:hypothetical protein
MFVSQCHKVGDLGRLTIEAEIPEDPVIAAIHVGKKPSLASFPLLMHNA